MTNIDTYSEFKTHKQFTDDAVKEIVTRSNGLIINPVTGSVIKSIIEAVCSFIFFIQTMIKKVYRNVYDNFASGLFLDMIGMNWLLTRRLPTYATTNVLFTRSNDTIEETLQAGCLCTTVNDSTGIRKDYILQDDVTFIEGVSEAYGVVQCTTSGTFGNTTADSIVVVRNNSIGINEITNPSEVNNGVDIETDEEFRTRIQNHKLGLLGANRSCIRDAALSVEGVTYAFVNQDNITSGVSYLYVNNQDGNLDISIINEVRDAVNEVRAEGVTINVSRSKVRLVSIDVTVHLLNNFFDNNITTTIKTSIKNFINSLKPSSYLRFSDLYSCIDGITGVDYVVNTDGVMQLTIDDDYLDIEDVGSYEMIRTTNDLITVTIV